MIAAGNQVIEIPLTQIRPLFGQPREHFDFDRLQELAESMRSRGQLQPVVVRATGEAAVPWSLVDGERRYRAAQIAKLHTLKALVSSVGKGDEEFISAVVANSAREDLTALEQSRAVARIAMMPGYDPKTRDGLAKLAAVFGRSQGWISRLLQLDSVAPDVKRLVEQKKLSPTAAAQLSAVKSPARQVEIGQRIASQPMRQSAAENAVKQAVKVEQVREGQTPKQAGGTVPRSTSSADAKLVAEMVGRVKENAEALLDLPVERLRAAYAGRPGELQLALKRVREAAASLGQLHEAMSKLGGSR